MYPFALQVPSIKIQYNNNEYISSDSQYRFCPSTIQTTPLPSSDIEPYLFSAVKTSDAYARFNIVELSIAILARVHNNIDAFKEISQLQ